jgi:hypothetical protein
MMTRRIIQVIGILMLIFSCVGILFLFLSTYQWLLLTYCLNLSLPDSIRDIEIAQIDESTNCVTLVRFTIDPEDLYPMLKSSMIKLPLSSKGDPFRLNEGIKFDIFWPRNWPQSLPSFILWAKSGDRQYPETMMIDASNEKAYVVYIQAYGKTIF